MYNLVHDLVTLGKNLGWLPSSVAEVVEEVEKIQGEVSRNGCVPPRTFYRGD